MGTRIYGLSGSGLDVDALVKQLMDAKRTQYNTLYKKKIQLEWKKAEYNTYYNKLTEFRNLVFESKLSANLMPKTVTSSNSGAVTAKANADAGNFTHSITVSQLADGVKLASSGPITTGDSKATLAEQFGLSGDPFTIKLTNGSKSKEITVDPNMSIYELVSAINNAGLDIRASYDANIDRFFLATTNTGSASGIDFTGSSPEGIDFLQDKLKINILDENGQPHRGQDAIVNLDGANLTLSSNTFTVSGVTYTLHGVTGDNPVNIVVNTDIDKIIENVKSFVNKYNELLEAINSELNETYYKDYLPLTDEEMAELKEAQVKAWEEKARSGLLRRDPILRSLVTAMRNSFMDSVAGLTGKYRNASSIGISTSSYTEGGKLYVDENKLRQALTEDPEIVYKIFGSSGDNRAANGVLNRLYDDLKTALDKIKSEAGTTASATYDNQSVLGKLINDYNERMDAMLDRLEAAEARYYKQFDALEVAISRMNQQSMWLFSFFNNQQG